jgi:acyl dehydratase
MTTRSVETDQAAREASGAHPYGRYLEEFEVGAVYKHWPAKTVTEAVSGKAIANLATEELKHPAPVFHGDTLFCESEVLEVRESQSKPDRGTVRVHTRVLNQDGVLVAEFKRLVLVPRKS